MTIQEAVRSVRKRHKWTQQDLAERLSVTLRTVVRYENDQPPTGKTLKQLWTIADSWQQEEEGKAFREAYLDEVFKRDGLRGEFILDNGPVRARVSRFVEILQPCFEPPVSTETDQVRALATVLGLSWEGTLDHLLSKLEIFEKLKRALSVLQQSAALDEDAESSGVQARYDAALTAYNELAECLNSFFAWEPVSSSDEL